MPPKVRVEFPKKVMGKKLEGEWVFLHLENGQYYSLNETGSLIWDELKEKKDPEAAMNRLQSDYRLERGQAEKDVRDLLKELEKEGLIRVEYPEKT